MKKTNQNQRRFSATFLCGIDPRQDQIIDWIDSLPVAPKTGAIRRSVVKYHITEALLDYIKKTRKKAKAVK